MRRQLSSLFLLLLTSITFAQNTNQLKTFEGFYRGDKLKIQCRQNQISPWQKCNCLDSVIVNSKKLEKIEIDQFDLNINENKKLEIYQKVDIQIHYNNKCQLRIINPNQFFPKKILPAEDVKIDTSNKIHWRSPQNFPDIRLWTQVEQNKWGEWVKIGPNFNVLEEDQFEFDLTPFLNKGLNEFRVTVANIDYEFYPSEAVSIEVKKKKAKAKYKKKKQQVIFNDEHHFIFYNDKKDVISRGFAKEIDTKNQKSGTYSVHYANKFYEFKIK